MPRQYPKNRVYVPNRIMPRFRTPVQLQPPHGQQQAEPWNMRFINPYAYAQNIGRSMEEVRNQIDRLYNIKKGKSFKGFCGLYVDFQLRALGIFPAKTSYMGHGNTWYTGITPQHVSKQYRLKKYPGSNCLEDILRDSGFEAHNIVVCFSRGRFGHVLFIHAILNGRVLFTDSFAFHNIEERRMHILSIPAFKSRYLGRGHRFIGALHFKKISAAGSY